MQTTEKITVDVPVEFFFDIITDYTTYPEFLPENRAVKVIKQECEKKLVRFEVDLIKKVWYVLQFLEHRPNMVEWQLVDSDLLKQNTGKWILQPESKCRTRATYELELSIRGIIPKKIQSMLISKNLRGMLKNFKRHAESKYRSTQ
jgi:ribosome-associated toxin RatA of RatAB toxin-antitoxin module